MMYRNSNRKMSMFFFQAEDSIRDATVTGVQTCALPIAQCGRPGGVYRHGVAQPHKGRRLHRDRPGGADRRRRWRSRAAAVLDRCRPQPKPPEAGDRMLDRDMWSGKPVDQPTSAETPAPASSPAPAPTPASSPAPAPTPVSVPPPMERVLYEVKKIIVGQDHLLERMVVALLARGHLLVEGVPGLAKTMAIKTLAQAVGGEFKRIQLTPDLVPADLIGTRIYNQKTGDFSVSLGPVFTNLLLADEINRAPAKVQSALLEVMQERQVTIGRETFAVPNPFLVLATQNPIETEGTYALPEAQIDRFMLKVLVGYPTTIEEYFIVERMTGALQAVQEVISTEDLLGLQQAADRVYVDPALFEYAVHLATATRDLKAHGLADLARYVSYGASPRASINLILTARALAFVRGRDYALPQDVRDMVLDVMRHRLVLSFEALSDNVTGDDLLKSVLDRIPMPVVPLREHGNVRASA